MQSTRIGVTVNVIYSRSFNALKCDYNYKCVRFKRIYIGIFIRKIYHEISLRSIPQDAIDDKTTLEQLMTWGPWCVCCEYVENIDHYGNVKWPSWRLELPMNRVFVEKFVQTNNRATSEVCVTLPLSGQSIGHGMLFLLGISFLFCSHSQRDISNGTLICNMCASCI